MERRGATRATGQLNCALFLTARQPSYPFESKSGILARHSVHRRRPMTTLDRYRGCLLGLAAGDALGTTLEFKQPGSFTPLTDMVGGGPFNLKPGEWTDDTSMALCLAESLVTQKRLRPDSPARNLRAAGGATGT